jgi:hypothetical protein
VNNRGLNDEGGLTQCVEQAMTDMPRYRIEKAGERFIIAHGRDPDLVWARTHWADREESGVRPLNFPDRGAAVKAAHEVFGQAATGPEQEP